MMLIVRAIAAFGIVFWLTACEENKQYTCLASAMTSAEKPKEIHLVDSGMYFKSCNVNGKSVGDTCPRLIGAYSSDGYNCKAGEAIK